MKATIILTFSLMLLFAAATFGQSSGATVTGKITDSNGASLANALVALVDTQTNARRTTVTDADGAYQFTNLPAGNYKIRVEASGFASAQRENLSIGTTSQEVNFTLEVGGLQSVVTVTAQRREEEELKTPATVTALAGEQLEQSNVFTTESVPEYVPNLRFVTSGARNDLAFVIMRGYTISTAATDTSTAVYLDGIPLNDLYSFNQNLFDVERVEILKGPQGTLYGGNSEAGVVNIITRQPTNDFRGFVNATYGQFNTYNFNGGVSGAVLPDKLLFSVSGAVNGHGGYLRNLISGERKDNSQFDTGARARLLYFPTKNLTVNFTGYFRKINDRGGFLEPPINLDSFNRFLRGRGFTNLTAGKWDYAVNFGGFNRSTLHGEAIQVDYHTRFFDFNYTFAHRKNNTRTKQDGDGFPIQNFLGFTSGAFQEWNNEFQFRSPSGATDRLAWVAGGQITDLDQFFQNSTTYLPGNPFQIFGGLGEIDSSGRSDIQGKSYAVYGQGTARFFRNRLGVTAGLRYNRSLREIDRGPSDFVPSPLNPNLPSPLFPLFPRTRAEYDDDEWLPKFAIDYRVGENALVYASAGKGWKTGGLNQYSATPALLRYEKQTSWTYETGAKTAFFRNRVSLKAAIFYTDGRDFQENVSDNFFNFYFANAGSVEMFGADFEANLAPVAGLDLSATFGPIKTNYKDYSVFQTGNFSYVGRPLRFVPNYDASLIANYRFQTRALKNFYVRGEALITGRFFDYRNNFVTNQIETTALGRYTVFNAGAGYDAERWNVGFFVNNVGDKRYFTRPFFLGSFSGYADPFGIIGARRVATIKVGYRF